MKAKCKLACGATKEIGIVGLLVSQTTIFASMGQTLLELCKDGSGSITKGDIVAAKNEMLALERHAD